MGYDTQLIAFGPVPSRRFGQSLGINNIPPKICTYSCIYCQIGSTHSMNCKREQYYQPYEIVDAVKTKIENARRQNEHIDYLTFVPDGEPTLDCNLGDEIEHLQTLKIKIAVITNASLLWLSDVQDELSNVDCVSVKIDAITETNWRQINRPHRSLSIDTVLSGLVAFSRHFQGDLITETMCIKGINDSHKEQEKLASFIEELNAKKSYLSIPTRPPAERWALPADESALNQAYQIFMKRGIETELLTGYEGNAFAFTGDVYVDLLSITSVHPMREDGVKEFLLKAKGDWGVVDELIKAGKLVVLEYGYKRFYMRKLR